MKKFLLIASLVAGVAQAGGSPASTVGFNAGPSTTTGGAGAAVFTPAVTGGAAIVVPPSRMGNLSQLPGAVQNPAGGYTVPVVIGGKTVVITVDASGKVVAVKGG